MFDSTPFKSVRPAGQNEIIHALVSGRGSAKQNRAARGRLLDLIALWNDDVSLLRSEVELETDWGPFELADITPAYFDAYGARRVFCRFVFHGEPKDRFHFEQILFERLNRITSWKFAPRAETTDTD
ncbi:hypothetical protein PUV54_03200 [Hyphococcus flavus]|uniref:Uncharacterized protein n=1 Tax=Hyphococcus flavus TaxID=1866326 RepID=A0AAE9ZC82_9PROT|nr:hypothetical protein [Hyphococcus flavus]WDI32198.1 hypothetical protein PUV54_03200 [Hyphococcus flavus]